LIAGQDWELAASNASARWEACFRHDMRFKAATLVLKKDFVALRPQVNDDGEQGEPSAVGADGKLARRLPCDVIPPNGLLRGASTIAPARSSSDESCGWLVLLNMLDCPNMSRLPRALGTRSAGRLRSKRTCSAVRRSRPVVIRGTVASIVASRQVCRFG
jgi:hypothetical protein